jgi:YidC/Oxa1 family membrane protein insertase
VEKRFVSFIILSTAILLAYQLINARLHPRPQPPAANAPAEQPEADQQAAAANAAVGADAQAEGDGRAATTVEQLAAGVADGADAVEAAPAEEAEPPQPRIEPQWATLGSLDPSRPERMLVWFTNQGAAIECLALNDAHYLDLDVRHGYLGYLALRDTGDGCRIGAVGSGTPAAEATPAVSGLATGLQAGDILLQLDDQPIAVAANYQAALERTLPGQTLRVQVRRNVNGQWSTLDYTATLRRRPLEVMRPEPEQPRAAEPLHPRSYLLGLQRLGDKTLDFTEDELPGLPSLKRENWELRTLEQDGVVRGIEFHFLLTSDQLKPFGVSGPLRIIKRFTLEPAAEDAPQPNTGFHLNYELIFRNEATGGAPLQLAYQQNGPTGLPLEGWWYTYKTHPRRFGSAGVRDVVFKLPGGRHEMLTNPKIVERIDQPSPMYLMWDDGKEHPFSYVGVDSQYFLSALLPDPTAQQASPESYRLTDAMGLAVARKDPLRASCTDVSFRLISSPQTVKPNEELGQRFVIFAGPKRPDVLAQYGLQECITYGWFRVVAKPLQAVLHGFYAVFRNYGIAIILLTVLVRGLMFPLGRQQVVNAQKMQELAPEMRRIAEEHKNDMEKRAAAQRELFRKHNYNPMAGCLPMFFQLPIFIGLYRALSVDIQLRQAPLIPGLRWCSNLAGPDMLLNWEAFMPAFLGSYTGFLGPYLNVLPLVSVAFMMLHQKMFTPPPTDEQQRAQQAMMKFMMVFFAMMFFKVPSGLCLYFITSSAWGLAERMLVPVPTGKATAGESPSPGGFLRRLQPTNGAKTAGERRRQRSKRR